MRRAELKVRLRSAIADACERRGDTAEHRAACIREVFEEAEKDWPWWLWYFETQAGHATATFEEWRKLPPRKG